MKQIIITATAIFSVCQLRAQTAMDTTIKGNVTVIKDARMEELTRKEAAFNEMFNNSAKLGKGFRLVVLSTTDRQLAQKVRAQLLQRYPDQKAYTVFQSPNIKIKFGNFVEKTDAENMRNNLIKNKIVTGNIYIVPEMIEVKPDKNKDKEKDTE